MPGLHLLADFSGCAASPPEMSDPDALRLRTMHLAYESVKQSGGTLVIPSAFSEGFVPEAGEKTGKAL